MTETTMDSEVQSVRADRGSKGPTKSCKAQADQLRSALAWMVALLGGFGLVMIFAATYFTASANGGTPWGPALHQGLWLVLGGLAFVGASRIRPSQLRALSPVFVVVVLALLGAVLLPGVGSTVNGSSRWFIFGPIQIQPSEIAKLVLILHLSRLLSRSHPLAGFRKRTLPALVVLGLFALLVLIEPDMGTAVLLCICGFGLLIASGTSVRELLGTGLLASLFGYYFAFSKGYRRARMLSFLHPWLHRATWSYQEVQSLAAFATGHFTGVGLGAGQSSYSYLPNAQTDFIFSVVGQDLGFVGALALLGALFALVILVLKSARLLTRPMDSLFALGVAAWVGGQVVLNVAAVEGLAPVTGVPLPLVSAGGSSMVVLLVALGLVRGALRAVREGDRPAEIEVTDVRSTTPSKAVGGMHRPPWSQGFRGATVQRSRVSSATRSRSARTTSSTIQGSSASSSQSIRFSPRSARRGGGGSTRADHPTLATKGRVRS